MNRVKEIKNLLGDRFSLIKKNIMINISNDYYCIDYLFYNDLLKCYILIMIIKKDVEVNDIKIISNCLKYIDKIFKNVNDNKTIGILINEKENNLSLNYISDFDRLRKVLRK